MSEKPEDVAARAVRASSRTHSLTAKEKDGLAREVVAALREGGWLAEPENGEA